MRPNQFLARASLLGSALLIVGAAMGFRPAVRPTGYCYWSESKQKCLIAGSCSPAHWQCQRDFGYPYPKCDCMPPPP